MAGVQRQKLKDLQLNSQNSIIIGIIISSLNPKNFESSTQQYGLCGSRSVWTFTLRDSPEDIINVTVWGRTEYIQKIFNTYRIGQVVEVINSKVTIRKMDSVNELYVPSASSPYALVVNEGAALIQAHDSPALESYLPLMHMITKPISEVRSLKDVLSSLEELQESFICLLVVVTFVGQAQEMTTRQGRKLTCRILEVRDGSTECAVQLRLWEHEWVRMSEIWEPNRTVLFIADARVTYNNYKKQIAITIVRKTLLIEDPDIPEVTPLRKAIRPEQGLTSSDPFALPNLKMITNVMTIQDITEKLNENSANGKANRLHLLTVIYAGVTEINLDADVATIVFTKCALCKRIIAKDNDSCMNLDCPSGNGSRMPNNITSLNLKVHLKDETGYLVGCRLFGATAENTLEKTATEIQEMNEEERSKLKWKLMYETFEVRLQVLGPTAEYPRAIYNILSLDLKQQDLLDFFSN